MAAVETRRLAAWYGEWEERLADTIDLVLGLRFKSHVFTMKWLKYIKHDHGYLHKFVNVVVVKRLSSP